MIGKTNADFNLPIELVGTAHPSTVLSGYTFYSTDINNLETGTIQTIPVGTAKTFTPSLTTQYYSMPAGYSIGSTQVVCDPIPDSAFQTVVNTIRSTSVASGGTNTTSVLNAWTGKTTVKYCTAIISCINAAACVLQASHDNTTFVDVGTIDNSTGSSTSSTNLNTNIAAFANLPYKYYRLKLTGFANGNRASCGMVVLRSTE